MTSYRAAAVFALLVLAATASAFDNRRRGFFAGVDFPGLGLTHVDFDTSRTSGKIVGYDCFNLGVPHINIGGRPGDQFGVHASFGFSMYDFPGIWKD